MMTSITETANKNFDIDMKKVFKTLHFLDDYFDLATNGCEFRSEKFINDTNEESFLIHLESYVRTICAHALNTWLSRRERGGIRVYNEEIYEPKIQELLKYTEIELKNRATISDGDTETYHAFMLWDAAMRRLAGFGDKLAKEEC